ncbi:TetR/AcrR family transcriptional regulator [Hyalangium versicolor]|uniref:TetR/AcrR family transcriptional regulator n=1 Tax=Hyalangium versicolor TaxID=2861190 RepID=UPI001CD01FA6|nr:TetR/AcrR family transcriptional regulator [Hyalangium versicolor]
MKNPPPDDAVPEGRRERKRRETRQRIVDAAMKLFLDRGYEATTMNDIADAADVSRRSLFDYFPTKEDVLFAGQDDFIPALVEEMRQRPKGEPWPVLVEHAMARAIEDAATPESFAIEALVQRTPSLQPRRQLKYMRLEQAIGEALAERGNSGEDRQRAALLAAVVVAGFRLAASAPGDARLSEGVHQSVSRDFRGFWQALRDFGEEGLAPRTPSPATLRRRDTPRKKGNP